MGGEDLEAEIHPLKNDGGKWRGGPGARAGKGGGPRSPAPQPRLSRCRTAAFFLSLFACLLVVFVVSFAVPCPDRPAPQGAWSVSYDSAGTPRPGSSVREARPGAPGGAGAGAGRARKGRGLRATPKKRAAAEHPGPNRRRGSRRGPGRLRWGGRGKAGAPPPSTKPAGVPALLKSCPGGVSPAPCREWLSPWPVRADLPEVPALLGVPDISLPGREAAGFTLPPPGTQPMEGRATPVTYDFLATEDINRDRIQDVLFLYKSTKGSSHFNLSCADEGFSYPCTFAAAMSGANGSMLWERPAAQDGALVACAVPQPGGSGASACIIVGRPGPFVAVDASTGQSLWNRPSGFGSNVSVLGPPLQVPDADADGAPDLLVLTQEEREVIGYVYSGSTGKQIGRGGCLGVDGTSGSLLHVTRAGAHYILLPCAHALCGCSVKGLYEKVTERDSALKKDALWEDMLSTLPGRLPRRSSGAIHHLMSVPGDAGEDLLLVSSEACVLLDGQDLAPRWTLSVAQVPRKPVLGHYKPDTLAVVIENGTGIDRQILLSDLSTGAVLWSQALPGLPGDPQSASLPTADHRSAFFFWGLREPEGANQTERRDSRHSLYMLHPTLPGILLELANVSANIVAFQVALFEPGRHAAFVLLTGPASPHAPGLVSVVKRKVRDLVPGSRVVRLAAGVPDSDQAIRDRFSRLRYRREA